MITKNFKSLMFACCSEKYADLVTIQNTVTTAADSALFYFFDGSNAKVNTSTSSNAIKCVLGNGTTKETESDYKLSSQINTLTNNSFSLSNNAYNDGVVGNEMLQYVATFTNNTSEEVTVCEIGLIWFRNSNEIFLMARQTFEPVTFGVGETKTFKLTVS